MERAHSRRAPPALGDLLAGRLDDFISTSRLRVSAGGIRYAEEIDLSQRQAPTATLLDKVKRDAKRLSREGNLTHAQALEQLAQRAGYSSYRELSSTVSGAAAARPSEEFPIDPELPERFDSTPNERRSKRELDRWWDRPFGIRQEDGSITVRCLDGGAWDRSAWDRSTWYGHARSVEEARQIGRDKLAMWQGLRSRPTLLLDDPPKVVRMPQRPDREMEVLYIANDFDDASRWLREHEGKQGN